MQSGHVSYMLTSLQLPKYQMTNKQLFKNLMFIHMITLCYISNSANCACNFSRNEGGKEGF